MDGWVSIHRKITQWQWYSDANTARVFIHLLIIANHSDGFYQGYPVKRGQRVTSPDKLAAALGLSRQKVRTALDKLVSTNEITIKTTNKFSVVTIENYDFYQSEQREVTTKTTTKATNKQPSNNHQITTNNNDNNDNNEKQKKFTPPELSEVMAYVSEKSLSVDPKRFYDYFTAGNWHDSHGKPVKNWKQKIITWGSHNQPAPQKPKPNIPYQQPYHYED